MTNIPYVCWICGQPGTVEGDQIGINFFGLGFWQSKLVHDPCAEYQEQRNRLIDRICKVGFYHLSLVRSKAPPEKVQKISGRIECLLMEFRNLVAAKAGVEAVHESGWRELIEAHPENTVAVICRMEREIVRETQ